MRSNTRTPHQALDPDRLLQQRALRHGRRANRDQGGGGGAPLLRQAVSQLDLDQSALLAGLPRRLRIQPVPVPEGGPRAAQRGARRRWPNWLHQLARAHDAEARPAADPAQQLLLRECEESSSNTCATARTALRQNRRPGGRAEGLHDADLSMQRMAREAIAEGPLCARRPVCCDRHAQPCERLHRGDGQSETFEQSQFNLAADGRRQPGSTFKAIDLADALRAASTRTPPTTSRTRSPRAGTSAPRTTKSRPSRGYR